MACNRCSENWFWKKIGRCQRCMNQLCVLSVLSWLIWWWLYSDTPASIESVGLIFACLAFNGLLALHLWMKFVVFPLRTRKKKTR
ncbi:DUF3624 domain-containing protein [Vibrio tapetis subsp. quintayensis]|uniref:DUF3624 domain-containing protein n=1 Tax=Vibrio tapetis TaxID=52443 RepID=UPI0025B6104D|nr:DUF3624 domain-containing protein [Vibrio tapetis]MDN3678980.1 DUF3624 domain-containing protein [Vibrio tapetis subsp. quintayensis]